MALRVPYRVNSAQTSAPVPAKTTVQSVTTTTHAGLAYTGGRLVSIPGAPKLTFPRPTMTATAPLGITRVSTTPSTVTLPPLNTQSSAVTSVSSTSTGSKEIKTVRPNYLQNQQCRLFVTNSKQFLNGNKIFLKAILEDLEAIATITPANLVLTDHINKLVVALCQDPPVTQTEIRKLMETIFKIVDPKNTLGWKKTVSFLPPWQGVLLEKMDSVLRKVRRLSGFVTTLPIDKIPDAFIRLNEVNMILESSLKAMKSSTILNPTLGELSPQCCSLKVPEIASFKLSDIEAFKEQTEYVQTWLGSRLVENNGEAYVDDINRSRLYKINELKLDEIAKYREVFLEACYHYQNAVRNCQARLLADLNSWSNRVNDFRGYVGALIDQLIKSDPKDLEKVAIKKDLNEAADKVFGLVQKFKLRINELNAVIVKIAGERPENASRYIPIELENRTGTTLKGLILSPSTLVNGIIKPSEALQLVLVPSHEPITSRLTRKAALFISYLNQMSSNPSCLSEESLKALSDEQFVVLRQSLEHIYSVLNFCLNECRNALFQLTAPVPESKAESKSTSWGLKLASQNYVPQVQGQSSTSSRPEHSNTTPSTGEAA